MFLPFLGFPVEFQAIPLQDRKHVLGMHRLRGRVDQDDQVSEGYDLLPMINRVPDEGLHQCAFDDHPAERVTDHNAGRHGILLGSVHDAQDRFRGRDTGNALPGRAAGIEREGFEEAHVGRAAAPAEIDTDQRDLVLAITQAAKILLGLIEETLEPLDIVLPLPVLALRCVVVPPVHEEYHHATLTVAVGVLDQPDGALELGRGPGFTLIVEFDECQRVAVHPFDVLRPVQPGTDAPRQDEDQDQYQDTTSPRELSIEGHRSASLFRTCRIQPSDSSEGWPGCLSPTNL